MQYDSGSTTTGVAGTFEIFRAEGDMLFKQGEPRKALDSYQRALDLRPEDKSCLVSRSQCYLQLGDSEAALIDAEAVLKDDIDNTKGLLQKAEALYCKGDFEYALVFYHRGNKLRPEVQAFRLGIQKSQEAIENCIGDEAPIRLQNKGDLSYFFKQDEKIPKKEDKKTAYSKPVVKSSPKNRKRPKSVKDTKTIKQLLGELYADREYLEKLLQETENASNNSETNMSIRDLAIEGLNYLDTRTDFWQQQKPMYARKRDRAIISGGSRPGTAKKEPTAYILKALEEIDEAQAQGNFEESLKMAKKAMKDVDKWSEQDLPNRPEFVANLHSAMGNAYLELGNYNQALDHHNVDKEIAGQQELDECRSRALDNLGRVYARMGKFEKAIELWEEKVPISKSPLERTWLYHEIGRCYLEKGNYEVARDNGELSLKEAEQAKDDVWQLNASVLVAQSQMKLGDYSAALDYFEKSLEMAKLQNDKMAEKAIKHAISDANSKITKALKGEDDEDDKKSTRTDKSGSDKVEDDDKSAADIAAMIRSSAKGDEDDKEDKKDDQDGEEKEKKPEKDSEEKTEEEDKKDGPEEDEKDEKTSEEISNMIKSS